MSILKIENERPHSKSDIVFVIAAPHSKKDLRIPGRSCDENALNAAKEYRAVLQSFKNYPYVFHVSDSYRSIIDYNRRISRTWQWRKDLDATIDDLSRKYKYVVVLETHSFPPKYASFKKDSALVFLNHPATNSVSKYLGEYFDERREHGDIKCNTEVVTGNTVINDIQLSAVYGLDDKHHRDNVYPVLCEFNEDRTITTPKCLHDLAKTVIQFFISRLDDLVRSGSIKTAPRFKTVIDTSVPPSATASGFTGSGEFGESENAGADNAGVGLGAEVIKSVMRFSGAGVRKIHLALYLILAVVVALIAAFVIYRIYIFRTISGKENMTRVVKPKTTGTKSDNPVMANVPNRAEISHRKKDADDVRREIDVSKFEAIPVIPRPEDVDTRGIDGTFNANPGADPSLLGQDDAHIGAAKKRISRIKIIEPPDFGPGVGGKNIGQDAKRWWRINDSTKLGNFARNIATILDPPTSKPNRESIYALMHSAAHTPIPLTSNRDTPMPMATSSAVSKNTADGTRSEQNTEYSITGKGNAADGNAKKRDDKEEFSSLISRTAKPAIWDIESKKYKAEVDAAAEKGEYVPPMISTSDIIPSLNKMNSVDVPNKISVTPVLTPNIPGGYNVSVSSAILPPLMGEEVWNVTTLYDTNEVADINGEPTDLRRFSYAPIHGNN